MNKTIGILGGTFDPIHLGHLHLAEEAYKQLNLSEVRLIPAYQPVHRDLPDATAKDRLQMVKLAIANQPEMQIDDREIRRQGPSYMIDTLKSIKAEIPNSILYLILATDAFAGFPTWHQWQEILKYAHIIVGNRPNISLAFNAELKKFLQEYQIKKPELLTKKSHGYIYFMDISPISISGTTIRQQIVAGGKKNKFLPTAVWEYIKQHGLYDYRD